MYDLRNPPWMDSAIDINRDLQMKNTKLYALYYA